jgi:hypothetical protein
MERRGVEHSQGAARKEDKPLYFSIDFYSLDAAE